MLINLLVLYFKSPLPASTKLNLLKIRFIYWRKNLTKTAKKWLKLLLAFVKSKSPEFQCNFIQNKVKLALHKLEEGQNKIKRNHDDE